VPLPLADTRAAGPFSTSPAFVRSIVSQCTVTMGGHAEALIRKWGFISPTSGAGYVRRYCALPRCVRPVGPVGALWRPRWWTISSQLSRVALGLIGRTSSRCASLATTAKRQRKQLHIARPPRGGQISTMGKQRCARLPRFLRVQNEKLFLDN
jgi:hypothetical protein